MSQAISGFRFSVPIPVRFNETDASGHVNPVNYFIYLSEARNRYFEHLGIFDEPWNRPGRPTHYSVHLGCDYRGPLVTGQTVHACARVIRLGRTSVEMEFALVVQGRRRPAATGRTVCIHWDPSRGGVAPLRPRWRRAMEAFEGRPLAAPPPTAPPGRAIEPTRRGFRFSSPISIRLAETDANGHANDISYLLYSEVSRHAYFDRLASYGYRPAADPAEGLHVAHLSCDYRSQLRLGQTVRAASRVVRLERSGVECAFALVASGERLPAATGRGRYVYRAPGRRGASPLPPDLRRAIAALEGDPGILGPRRGARRMRDLAR